MAPPVPSEFISYPAGLSLVPWSAFCRSEPLPLLEAALSDLRLIQSEAQEDGNPAPTDELVKGVKDLLVRLYEEMPRRYEVDAGTGGEILIQTFGKRKSVLILCDPSGDVTVMGHLTGEHEDRTFESLDVLPNGYLIDSIKALDRR